MARDLSDVLEAIVAGIVVVDRDGRVELLNGTACRLLEHSAELAQGTELGALLGPDHVLAEVGRRVLGSGVSSSVSDVRLDRRIEGPVEIDVAASPLFCDRGELDGCVLILRDREPQRRVARLETLRERYASFGSIAAGLAHEIKNPLGGIRGAGELLARRAEDPKTAETADLIVREATRIASLVDEFMVFTRGGALKLAAVNVHELLDDVLALLSHDPLAEGVDVVRAYDPSLPEFLADGDRLTQVFLNLARNALQAMPSSAERRLTVRTRMSIDQRISVETGTLVPAFSVTFLDTGPGFSEELLKRATTPFVTTREGGTGLGLAVAQYWANLHSGNLQLANAAGGGAEVVVTLPLRRDT